MKKIISNLLVPLLMTICLNLAVLSGAKASLTAVINEQVSKEAKVVKNIAQQISAKRDKYQKQISAQEKS